MFPRLSLLAAVLLPFIGGVAPCQAQEKLVLASGAQGNWETAAAELGRSSGIFRKHGLEVELLWTQGGGETQQAVTSGSADIGIGLGLAAVMSAYAKGAPVRPVANAMTGPDVYWYVPAASPIQSLKDAAGKTMSFSTVGSSTYIAVLGLRKLFLDSFVLLLRSFHGLAFVQSLAFQVLGSGTLALNFRSCICDSFSGIHDLISQRPSLATAAARGAGNHCLLQRLQCVGNELEVLSCSKRNSISLRCRGTFGL